MYESRFRVLLGRKRKTQVTLFSICELLVGHLYVRASAPSNQGQFMHRNKTFLALTNPPIHWKDSRVTKM